jgi:hypothetical protein
MERNYSSTFTEAEVDYLNTACDAYGWYVWTEETRSIIANLCARRLMAANGDFKVIAKIDKPAAGRLGNAAPTIARYFELIGEGRAAFRILRNNRPASRSTNAVTCEVDASSTR